jgi:hypothetical protein
MASTLNALAFARGLRNGFPWLRALVESIPGGTAMATKAHRRFGLFHRLRDVAVKVGSHWLSGVIVRTLATVVVTLVARWLGLQSCRRP